MPDRAERRRTARAAGKQPPDPKLVAAVDLVGRTGAADVQIRYSDDEQPVVWFAVARFHTGPEGRPHRGTGEPDRWETAAGRDPTEAVLRLCERLVDGGQCQHCKKPAMFHADLDTNPTPLDPLFCSYEWDPELETFRRSCEGDG
jgi:hypothetical protein